MNPQTFPPSEWQFLPEPTVSLATLIETHAIRRRDELAIRDGETARSWGELGERVVTIAAHFRRIGIRPGERLILLTGNSVAAYEAIFAAIHIGAVPAPLSPLFSPQLLARLLNDCKAAHAIVAPGLEALWQAACQSGTVRTDFTRLDHLPATGGEAPPVHPCGLHQPCMIFYSSGTTGEPKGIVQSQLARLWTASAMVSAFRFTADSRTLVTTPPFTNGTWIMVLPALFSGSPIYLQAKFDPGTCLEQVAGAAITHTFFVPTQLAMLVEHPDWGPSTLSSLQCVVSAGAPLAGALRARLIATLPDALHELWGLTEGIATIATPSQIASHPGTCGRPSGDAEIRVIDENGVEVPNGEAGEIVGRSLGLMSGYLGRADATRSLVWKDPFGRAFLRTGDIGTFDADGFLYIRGRKKEMIVSGGLNIYPVDIETALLEHPEIADVAVFGVAHEKWGETPIAYVRPVAGAELRAADVLDWSGTRVERFQRLSDVVITGEDFPRNALGKILKDKLLEQYIRGGGLG